MSKLRMLLATGAVVLVMSTLSVTAFASSAYSNPTDAIAALTGRTNESVVEERRETGNTYCTIADEAGVLDEYRSAILEMKKDTLNARVAADIITQEQADEILTAMEDNMASCDGTGGAMMGKYYGADFGSNDDCLGAGSGNGYNSQNGQRDGSQTRSQDGTCGN